MKGNVMNRSHRIETTTPATRGELAHAATRALRGGPTGAIGPIGVRSACPPAFGGMFRLMIALCVCACVLALAAVFAAPELAFAENQRIDAPVTVTDDVTHVDVSKLDADTHEFVQGATMVIINEETGEIVDQWVTGPTAHPITKMLDVGVVYILREVSAPSGFEKVQDVRFMVNKTEGQGITVLSGGDDFELTEPYRFALYDKPISGEDEIVVTRTNTKVAPKTGDETPLSLVAALMGIGISAILILQLFKRRIED